jgi:hypothetical protein
VEGFCEEEGEKEPKLECPEYQLERSDRTISRETTS